MTRAANGPGLAHIFGRFIRVRPMNPIKRIHYYIAVQAYGPFGYVGEQVPRREENLQNDSSWKTISEPYHPTLIGRQ